MFDEREIRNMLWEQVRKYTEFEVAGRKVKIPYVLGFGRWLFWKTCGKGNIAQIHKELEKKATAEHFNLSSASSLEINHFMLAHKIGIDCSGFVYQVLDPVVKKITGKNLGSYILKKPGWWGKLEKAILFPMRVRRIHSTNLTSRLNCLPIHNASNIRPGDLIRLSTESKNLGHVAIIIDTIRDSEKTLKKIIYAHSSHLTLHQGPHLGEIVILDPQNDLSCQIWQEMTKDGKNYGEVFFRPEFDNGVTRLKCLSRVYKSEN